MAGRENNMTSAAVLASLTARRRDASHLKQARAFFIALFAFTGIFGFNDLRAEEWSRTITLNVATDSAFRKRPDWETEIQKSVQAVSAIWERQFGIRWKVVLFSPWEPPVDDKFLNTPKLFGHLESTIASSSADVVLGFFESKCLHDYGGLSGAFGASALVVTGCLRQAGPRNTIEMVISHELAHLFGAFHVRPHIRSVMSGDGADIFDPQTIRVIRLMRDKDFDRTANKVRSLSEDKQAIISAIFSEGHRPDTHNPIATAYTLSGQFFLEDRRYNEALEAFRKANLIDSKWSVPYTGMGIAYEKLAKRDLAIDTYKAALSIDPADAQANAFLGDIRVKQGDEKGAFDNYATAVKSDPRSAGLRTNLGLGYMGQGKPREAEVEFREALRLDPNIPDGRNNLAASLGQQGKFEEAVKLLRETFRLNPTDAKAQGNLGYTLELMGDAKGALDAYRKAQAMDPSNRRNQVNLDRLLKRINKGEPGARPGSSTGAK